MEGDEENVERGTGAFGLVCGRARGQDKRDLSERFRGEG